MPKNSFNKRAFRFFTILVAFGLANVLAFADGSGPSAVVTASLEVLRLSAPPLPPSARPLPPPNRPGPGNHPGPGNYPGPCGFAPPGTGCPVSPSR